MCLHFYGEMFQFHVAADLLADSAVNLSFSPVFAGINLVSLLAPYGLLQHLWVLWEMVATGQDIVVVASTPKQCSEVVLALGSLLLPMQRFTDLRPFIASDDSDLKLLAEQARLKKPSTTSSSASNAGSIIIGVTDASVLALLDGCFEGAVFLSPISISNSGGDADFRGMRKRNTALLLRHHSVTTTAASDDKNGGSSLSISPLRRKRGSVTKTSMTTLSDLFREWSSSSTSTASAVVLHCETAGYPITKLLDKIKKMAPTDRSLLGDMLLRDHLRELTLGFLTATTQSTDLREEKEIQIHHQRRQQQQAAPVAMTSESTVIKQLLKDLLKIVRNLPIWLPRNVPTVLLWLLYLLAALLSHLLGLPTLLLVAGAFIAKVPEYAPRKFEVMLEGVLPLWLLYPTRNSRDPLRVRSSNNTSTTDELESTAINSSTSAASLAVEDGRTDFSGVWKRIKLVNYENLLGAQGAGFMQRKLAASIAMTHTITMDRQLTAFRLQEKGGPVETDQVYPIDGPEVATTTLKSDFLDKVTWEGGRLKIRKLRLPDHNYELIIFRELENGGKILKVSALYRDLKGSAGEVQAYSYFEYVGTTPHLPPDSFNSHPSHAVNVTDIPAEAIPTSATTAAANRKDFSGEWQRVKTHNIEAILGATGAGFMQRKMGAQMPLMHTITMDYPTLRAFRLHEKGGPIDINTTLTIGADFKPATINGKSVRQRVYWSEDNESLIFQRRFEATNSEMVMTRTIEQSSDEYQIRMKVVHIDLSTGREVEGISWFKRIGPSPEPPPVADEGIVLIEHPADRLEPQQPQSTASVEDSALETPTAVRALSTSALALSVEDNDDDDDEVAVSKMRSMSTLKQASFNSQLLLAGLQDPNNSSSKIPLFDSEAHTPIRTISTGSKKPDFSGIWKRNSDLTGSNNNSVKLGANLSFTNIISMSANQMRIQEFGGALKIEDTTYLLDSGEYIDTTYMKKRYKSRCYWEGATLVMHRMNVSDNYELVAKRDLEQDGGVIRLVSIYRNMITGEESESICLFTESSSLSAASSPRLKQVSTTLK